MFTGSYYFSKFQGSTSIISTTFVTALHPCMHVSKTTLRSRMTIWSLT